MEGSFMRIAYGRFSQESNTFSPVVTDMDVFGRHGYAVGDAIVPRAGGKPRNPVWAFADVCDARGGVELVPLVSASAGASGRVTEAAFDEVKAAFEEQLDALGEVDAVYMALHGAMV